MDQRVLDYLNDLTDASEASHVSTYTVWIAARELEVKVFDRGPGTGETRYSVLADWVEPDEEVAARGGFTYSLGNAAGTLASALENVHWWQFKK